MKLHTETEVKVLIELTKQEAEYLKSIVQNASTGNPRADEFLSTLWTALTDAKIGLP